MVNRKKWRFLVFLMLVSAPFCSGQQANSDHEKGYYKKQMLRLQQAIDDHFYDAAAGFYRETVVVENGKNKFSYLWPLCGMIQANNEIEKVTDQKNLVANSLNMMRGYYDPSAPAPGYASYIMRFKGGDRFYDDNQWIGIACMDAYARLHSKPFLAVGKEIYAYMMTGFDTTLSGGLYWQENKKISKNTCSNGPGIIVALQLYKALNDKSYLDTAILIYDWMNKKLKAPNGLYFDNISTGTNKIGRAMFSYNTGTMLQSNVYLFEITRDKKYLKEAVAIADSSMGYFFGNGKFRDSYWFNAVLLRGYQHLLKYNRDTRYLLAFKRSLDQALENNMNEMNLMGKEKPLELVPQSGMLEILARFAYLEATHKL